MFKGEKRMSKQKVSKSKLQQVSTKEESIVSKAKSKVSTKPVTPVEKKVSTPKPTIASLTKELEELKTKFDASVKLYNFYESKFNDANYRAEQAEIALKLAQRPWYVKIFDLFANK